MQLNRTELRKKIMTILYQQSVYEKSEINYNLDEVIKEITEIDSEFVKEIVYGVNTYKNDINAIANKHLKNWTINRLGNTDQAILRIAIFELLYTDTPEIVAINEAIELAKIYSDDEVRKMINAALDSIYHSKNE